MPKGKLALFFVAQKNYTRKNKKYIGSLAVAERGGEKSKSTDTIRKIRL